MNKEPIGLDEIDKPEFLYRYRSAETPYFLDEIENALESRIFLNPVFQQNDPFDCFPNYIENSPAEIKKFQDKFLRKKKYVVSNDLLNKEFGHLPRRDRIREVRKFRKSYRNRKVEQKIIKYILSEERKKTLIACFSETASNGLMWSHYATSHNGICKIFKVKNLSDESSGNLFPIKVIYSEKRPSISTIDVIKFTNQGELNFPEDTRRVFDAIVRRKPADWAYENEWRVHARRDLGGPIYHISLP